MPGGDYDDRRTWGPTVMNGGRVMRPDEFGGACRSAGSGGGDCRFQPNANRHTCRQSDAARWQCAASRLARAVVSAAMMEDEPAKISPEHVDYRRLVRTVVDAMKETQYEYARLPVAARFVPTRRINLTCRHATQTYDVFRVLDYLRDVTITAHPDLTDSQAREIDTAHASRDARRLVRAVETVLPERDRRVLRVRLSEWAEVVSREPPSGADTGTYELVRVILSERDERRRTRGDGGEEDVPPPPRGKQPPGKLPPPPPPRIQAADASSGRSESNGSVHPADDSDDASVHIMDDDDDASVHRMDNDDDDASVHLMDDDDDAVRPPSTEADAASPVSSASVRSDPISESTLDGDRGHSGGGGGDSDSDDDDRPPPPPPPHPVAPPRVTRATARRRATDGPTQKRARYNP